MTAENDKLTNETPENDKNSNNQANSNNPPAPKEDAMSILEKRLAEINARKSGAPTPAAPEPAPSAPSSQPAATLPPTADQTGSTGSNPSEIRIEKIESAEKPAPAPKDPGSDAATIAGGAIAAHEVIPPMENPISPVADTPERGPEASAIPPAPAPDKATSSETPATGSGTIKTGPETSAPVVLEQNPAEPAAPVQPIAFAEGLSHETTVAGSNFSESETTTGHDRRLAEEDATSLAAESGAPQVLPSEDRPVTGSSTADNYKAPETEIPTNAPNKDTGAIATFDTSAAGKGTVTESERDAALGDENSVGNVISGAIAMHEIIPEIMPGQRAEEEQVGQAPASGTSSSERSEDPRTPLGESEREPTPAPPESTATMAAQTPAAAGASSGSIPAAPGTTSSLQDDAGITEESEDTAEEDNLAAMDFAALPLPELERQLMLVLKNPENRKNHRHVNAMYREYEAKLAQEKNEALEKFVAEGGQADDFDYRLSPERQELEKAMQGFRESRVRDQRSEEEQKQKNLQRKQELIAQLREVVEAAETKQSAEKMKAIQEEWKATGPVPQNESQQLWNSYHALLDIFYNNRSIYFELKELDRKRNLNAKQQLIERAEALSENPSINASLQELRHLHEEWKNIGPVPNDQRDPIWERFIQASEKVHERKKEFLAGRREQEMENLVKKNAVLERLEPFQNFQTDRINDWRDKTEEIQAIKAEWDAIGLVPKENADQVNKRFWGVYKNFFHQKNQFFKALDDQKMQNLKLKTELCEQAEAIKDSTDWDSTKEQLIQLQKKWKTIGRVPDKYSDKVWERFRAACNEFFDRRQAESQNKEAELEKMSAEKTAYLDELTEKLSHHEHPQAGSVAQLNEMVAKWKSFDADSGRVNPRAEEKFYVLMERYLDTVPELSNDAKNDILFKLQLNKLKGGPDASNKLYQKEQGIRKEISQLENDIRTLKTNIEFFARSKNAEKLREEYQARTDEAHKRIEMLQKQLKEMRS